VREKATDARHRACQERARVNVRAPIPANPHSALLGPLSADAWYEHLAAYISELRRQQKSAATIDAYCKDLRGFAAWWKAAYAYGAPLDPARATGWDLADCKSYLRRERNLAPASINRIVASLRSYFRWCLATGQCRENPTERITRLVWLTLEEMNWLTYLRDAIQEALYQITGAEEDMPPEQEYAYVCLRAGMAAMFGILEVVPREMLHVMLKREILPREEDEQDEEQEDEEQQS
jgi:hypothetical protein